MKLLLLQDEIYLPSLGGGIKANRLLLEALARRGHEVFAIAPATTGAAVGPHSLAEFQDEMAARGITLRARDETYSFEFNEVRVDAISLPPSEAREVIRRRIAEIQPDWVIVNDDKRRILLEEALGAAPNRVAALLQTIIQLPFGPLAVQPNVKQADLLSRTTAIFVISRFLQDYLATHGGLKSQIVHLPVYGDGPFPNLARFDRGAVTMINPCDLKGLAIFLALAKLFPHTEFAAVPTWGTDAAVILKLQALPNMRILKASDDINEILRETRVLLVPSLWPETFGYVVPEAMLRGIPVLASNIGGLPEAKLGVDYLLPASSEKISAWANALQQLLENRETYDRVSRQSRDAAMKFVSQVSVEKFEQLLSRAPKHRIAIVDPYSAGNLLAAELKARGHECIAVQSTQEIPALYRSSFHPEHFVKVVEPAQLQNENVSCVIAGCELGVQCADALSEQLNLSTNGTKLSNARRDKKWMVEAVSKCGLRTPRQFASSSCGEIVDWARAQQRWPVIVKPLAGSGSESVRCCQDEAQVAHAFDQIIGRANMLGQLNAEVLVQEFLIGNEYVIDTVSCAGRHRRAAFWKYNRPAKTQEFVPYDSMQLMPYHGELQDKLFKFTCGVLDALEIRFGPAHCEVICVDGEPVLVEIAARMNGGSNATLSRICGGVCQLDLTIDAYLDPEKFLAVADDPLELPRSGANCFMMPHRAGILRTAPKLEKIESLSSFNRISFNAKPGEKLKRVAGIVTLVHEDDSVIARDIEQLRQLQSNGFYDLEEGPRGG